MSSTLQEAATDTSGDYRLLVRSIGTADAAVVAAIRRVRAAPDAELAGLLYRAPSELLTGLNHEVGSRLCDLLRQTGVDVDLVPTAEPFQAGTGDFEVALVIRKYDRMTAVIEETARVLGVPAEAAMKIVTAAPAVLLGGISEATVEALRTRYARIGVEVDASRTREARFDIAAEVGEAATRRLFNSLLAKAGVTPATTGPDQYLAADLDADTATQIWEQLSRTAAKVRVLNRDFERFDVRLDAAPPTPEMVDWLVSTTGMPQTTANSALSRTPVVIAESVTLATMLRLLEEAHSRGGRASAVLLPLQGFSLRVKPGGDRKGVVSWVEAIAGAADAERFVRGQPELPGPFNKTQGRWLQYELRKRGVHSHLVER